jgi:hypothetical protein
MINAIIIADEVHCIDWLGMLLADHCPGVEITDKCLSPKTGIEPVITERRYYDCGFEPE